MISVGDILQVAEPDYLYGRGTLRLRVTKVGEVWHLADDDWRELEGQELRNGRPLQLDPRPAWVRVQALSAGRRGSGRCAPA